MVPKPHTHEPQPQPWLTPPPSNKQALLSTTANRQNSAEKVALRMTIFLRPFSGITDTNTDESCFPPAEEGRMVPEASDRGGLAVLHPDDLQLHLQNALQIIKCVGLPTKKSLLFLCSVKGTWHWRFLVSTTSPVNVVRSTTHLSGQPVKSAVVDKSFNWFGN